MEGGLNSEVVTANACNCRLEEGCHVGQLLLVGSHRGPCFHRFDDLSCVELMLWLVGLLDCVMLGSISNSLVLIVDGSLKYDELQMYYDVSHL